MQTKNKQLRGFLDPKLLIDTISQAVTTILKVNSQPMTKGEPGNSGTRYIIKPHLGEAPAIQTATRGWWVIGPYI